MEQEWRARRLLPQHDSVRGCNCYCAGADTDHVHGCRTTSAQQLTRRRTGSTAGQARPPARRRASALPAPARARRYRSPRSGGARGRGSPGGAAESDGPRLTSTPARTERPRRRPERPPRPRPHAGGRLGALSRPPRWAGSPEWLNSEPGVAHGARRRADELSLPLPACSQPNGRVWES